MKEKSNVIIIENNKYKAILKFNHREFVFFNKIYLFICE